MNLQVMDVPSISGTFAGVPPGVLNDWGISLAILLFLAREAIAFFKHKDSQEATLTATLVNDLRATNQALLTQQAQAIAQQAEVLQQIGEGIGCQSRTNTEVLGEIRALRDLVVLQGEQCKALHARLDRQFAA